MELRCPAAGCLGLLLLAACSAPGGGKELEFRVPVSVREVSTGAVEDTLVATGTLRALETVSLRAETGGALKTGRTADGRRLNEGDAVRAGQVVAEITGDEIRLGSRSDANRQRYEAARRDYESRKRLFDEGLISEFDVRSAETLLADAKVDWERSQLTEVRSKLITPIHGLLLHFARDEQGLPLADGQLVAQGYLVAQVAPTTDLIADVAVVGPDISRIREGMPARIRHHARESQAFEGRVVRLAPAVDSTTRTLRAEVGVGNREGLLRPGMFVEVTIIAERREDVPVVPRDAVTERNNAKVVFVLDGQRVLRREVVLGLGGDDVIEVRQGLQPGERVVVRGLETLADGTKVRVSGA